MIVLPHCSLPAIDKGPLMRLASATSHECPVNALAAEFNELVREFNKEAKLKRPRKSVLERISNRLDHIEDEASRLAPQSADGVAFQIMLAAYLNAPDRHGPHAINEDYANKMSCCLLTQAMKFFGTATRNFPHALQYLTGIEPAEKR